AQVGIENLNIMAGFPRTAGLRYRGLHPGGGGRRTRRCLRPPSPAALKVLVRFALGSWCVPLLLGALDTGPAVHVEREDTTEKPMARTDIRICFIGDSFVNGT